MRSTAVRSVVVLAALLVGLNGKLFGQPTDLRYGVALTNSLSANSLVDVVEAVRPGSVEIDASTPLSVRGWWRLEYFAGVVPLAWIRGSIVDPVFVTSSHEVLVFDGVRRTSFGAGLRPLGLRMVAGSPPVAFETSVSGSVLFFNHPVPAANGARTNFSGSVAAGLRVRFRGNPVSVGYRLTHLSNAGRAPFNPGIDAKELYLGIWFQ